jgi:hypothetical protein
VTLRFKAGQELRRADGSLVLTFTRDLHVHDQVLAISVILPDGRHPSVGEELPPELKAHMKLFPLPVGQH